MRQIDMIYIEGCSIILQRDHPKTQNASYSNCIYIPIKASLIFSQTFVYPNHFHQSFWRVFPKNLRM